MHQVNVHHLFHRTLPEKLPTGRVALLSFAFLGTAVFRYYAGLVTRRQIGHLALAAAVVFAVSFGLGFRGPTELSDSSEEWSSVSMFNSYAGGAMLFALIFMRRAGEFPFILRWLGTISYSVYLLHYPVCTDADVDSPSWGDQRAALATGCAGHGLVRSHP